MRLIRPATFVERYFDAADQLDERTVRAWVESGAIVGKIVNTGRRVQVFVDADAWEKTTGNVLADSILERLGGKHG